MGDSKHTPGPWIVRPGDDDRPFLRLIFSNMDKDGSPRAGREKNGGIYIAQANGPDASANARLIAAAPELLEAARKAEALLGQRDGNGFGTTKMDGSQFYIAAEAIRAELANALAKTEEVG